MPQYYPIMLDVRNRSALVIGGNSIAAQKAAALASSGALVTVLHPDFCEELLLMEQRREVRLLRKAYEAGDLAGAFVVIAVTDDTRQIEEIWNESQQRGQLVNIVDVPARCSFILPSILRRDQLTIAVSTEGASPGLAKRIRQRLEALFPPAYGAYLRLAAIARRQLRQHGLSYGQRDEFFGEFDASDILNALDKQDESAALATTSALLRGYHIDVAPQTLANELRAGGEAR